MTSKTMTLDDILTDTLDSRYVDDTYYEILRNDLTEWKQLGVTLTEQERARYEQIVIDENWLLDQREFERWYQLFSQQCCYWAPANVDMPDPVAGDPQRQVTIFCDDRRGWVTASCGCEPAWHLRNSRFPAPPISARASSASAQPGHPR